MNGSEINGAGAEHKVMACSTQMLVVDMPLFAINGANLARFYT
jgi:hypothetical protein